METNQKKDMDASTLGLIVCKTKDKGIVAKNI